MEYELCYVLLGTTFRGASCASVALCSCTGRCSLGVGYLRNALGSGYSRALGHWSEGPPCHYGRPGTERARSAYPVCAQRSGF